MSKQHQSFKDAIKSYLDRRAEQDELFAKTYAKEGKTLDECCNYIIGKARKMAGRGNAVVMTDDEVYGLAVHYYDEDVLREEGTTKARPGENVEIAVAASAAQETAKESRQQAETLSGKGTPALEKKMPSRAKKMANPDGQMSLF